MDQFIKAEQMQTLNPILILTLVPIFDLIIYPVLAKCNLLVKPLQRITVGLFVTVLSFTISGLLEIHIQDSPEKSVHIFWQAPQYFVMTVAEIFVSITGIEFAYNQAPSSMKSIIQAFWLLTIAFGNLITMIVSSIGKFENNAHSIFLYTGIMVVCSIIFTFLAWRFVPRDARTEGGEKEDTKVEDLSEETNN